MEIDTQPKTPENPDPTPNVPPVESPIWQPSINPVVFPELPPAPRPTELKLASPKPFTGNREDWMAFFLTSIFTWRSITKYMIPALRRLDMLSRLWQAEMQSPGRINTSKSQTEENISTLELGQSLQKHYENCLTIRRNGQDYQFEERRCDCRRPYCEIQDIVEKGQDSWGLPTSNRLLHEVIADPLAKGSSLITHPA